MLDFLFENTRIEIGWVMFFVFAVLDAYYFIRNMLNSILWCEIGGKYSKVIRVKKGRSFWQKLTQTFYGEYIEKYEYAFSFWIIFKRVFVICEFLAFLTMMILLFTKIEIPRVITLLLSFQAFAVALVMVGLHYERLNKYDRIRMSRLQQNKNTKLR